MKRPIHLLIAGSLLVLQISLAVPAAGAHGSEEEHSQESAAPVAQSSEREAEEETDQNADKKANQKKPGENDNEKTASYEFVTEPGCSLSLLTRRALQLYDQQNEDVSLTPAAAMYAETNIVRRLGSRLLEIGERVKIDQPLLDEFVQKSKTLSPETLAAWDTYATSANFELSDITPATITPAVTDKPATDTDTAEDQPKDDEQATKDAETNRQPLSALWWLAGIATLAGIYYLLGRRKTS